MSNLQTILTIAIVALTALLIIVGVQVVLIIADVRRALKRLNTILDDAIIGGGLIHPIKISNLINLFRKRKNSG